MWLKIQLYIISMWILFLLLFISKVNVPICLGSGCEFIGWGELLSNNIIPMACLILMMAGGVFYFGFNYSVVKGAPGLPKKITKIEDLNYETLSFLVTYIVPLICFDFDTDLSKNRGLLMLVLVLTLMGWMYVKSNIFYTNPTLSVLGFRIYKIDSESSEGLIVIVKGRLSVGDNIYPRKIDDKIFYVKRA